MSSLAHSFTVYFCIYSLYTFFYRGDKRIFWTVWPSEEKPPGICKYIVVVFCYLKKTFHYDGGCDIFMDCLFLFIYLLLFPRTKRQAFIGAFAGSAIRQRKDCRTHFRKTLMFWREAGYVVSG